mmetsp:Transcript_28493/g.68541  ORF Transcript_28493/g.68541 Transcript_28493/m.68541 type:complete len:236 (-) Transcript_28493:480-1187(-)
MNHKLSEAPSHVLHAHQPEVRPMLQILEADVVPDVLLLISCGLVAKLSSAPDAGVSLLRWHGELRAHCHRCDVLGGAVLVLHHQIGPEARMSAGARTWVSLQNRFSLQEVAELAREGLGIQQLRRAQVGEDVIVDLQEDPDHLPVGRAAAELFGEQPDHVQELLCVQLIEEEHLEIASLLRESFVAGLRIRDLKQVVDGGQHQLGRLQRGAFLVRRVTGSLSLSLLIHRLHNHLH